MTGVTGTSSFAATLKGKTKRQSDVDFERLEARFKQRQDDQEQQALRSLRMEEDRANSMRKQKHNETLERYPFAIAIFQHLVSRWLPCVQLA